MGAQKNAFWEDREKAKEASRIAYANGESDKVEDNLDPSDPQYGAKKILQERHNAEKKVMGALTAAQKDDTDRIRSTLKQEKDATWSEVEGYDEMSARMEDRNSTALREHETKHKLQEELDLKAQRA